VISFATYFWLRVKYLCQLALVMANTRTEQEILEEDKLVASVQNYLRPPKTIHRSAVF